MASKNHTYVWQSLAVNQPRFLPTAPISLQVFVIEYSKEVFRDYGAYVKKVELYKKPLWSCKYTGRGALTFEDALAEEQKALASLAKVSEAVLAFLLRSFQPSIVG